MTFVQDRFQAGDLVRLKKRTYHSGNIVLALDVSDGSARQAMLSPGIVGVVMLDQLFFPSRNMCRVMIGDKFYDMLVGYLEKVDGE